MGFLGKERMIGNKIGRLTVIKATEKRLYGNIVWECLCDCGKIKLVRTSLLKSGHIKSCGCLHTKHGMWKSKIYGVWRSMNNRCHYTNQKVSKGYSLRGIRVCDEWKDFLVFIKDMGNSYKEGLHLDRINNDGDYCKENCRWVPSIINQNNRRDNIRVLYRGEVKTVSEWSRVLNIKVGTLFNRIYRKNSAPFALPLMFNGKRWRRSKLNLYPEYEAHVL